MFCPWKLSVLNRLLHNLARAHVMSSGAGLRSAGRRLDADLCMGRVWARAPWAQDIPGQHEPYDTPECIPARGASCSKLLWFCCNEWVA